MAHTSRTPIAIRPGRPSAYRRSRCRDCLPRSSARHCCQPESRPAAVGADISLDDISSPHAPRADRARLANRTRGRRVTDGRRPGAPARLRREARYDRVRAGGRPRIPRATEQPTCRRCARRRALARSDTARARKNAKRGLPPRARGSSTPGSPSTHHPDLSTAPSILPG